MNNCHPIEEYGYKLHKQKKNVHSSSNKRLFSSGLHNLTGVSNRAYFSILHLHLQKYYQLNTLKEFFMFYTSEWVCDCFQSSKAYRHFSMCMYIQHNVCYCPYKRNVDFVSFFFSIFQHCKHALQFALFSFGRTISTESVTITVWTRSNCIRWKWYVCLTHKCLLLQQSFHSGIQQNFIFYSSSK